MIMAITTDSFKDR